MDVPRGPMTSDTDERRTRNGGATREPGRGQAGRVGWIVLWLLGIPIPVLILLYLLRGCT
jgi:hypothetical protein